MSTLAERLKIAREAKKVSQKKLGKATRQTQQGIHRIEAGLVQRPQRLNQIADYLGVSRSWLQYGEGIGPFVVYPGVIIPDNFIPLLTLEEAVKWCLTPEEKIVTENTPVRPFITAGSLRCFMLRIIDDAMENSNGGKRSFLPNDFITADPEKTPVNGNFVLAILNNAQMIFRQYIVEGKNEYLRALNLQYDKIPVDETIKICAVVIHHGADI